MMTIYPLIHILFWIALACAPPHASRITIQGPDQSWTWTKQDSGWKRSVDKSVWTTSGPTVTSQTDEKTDKQDVSEFVKGVKEQRWNSAASLKLGPMKSLTKTGDAFIYTLNEGDPTQRRYVIAYQ